MKKAFYTLLGAAAGLLVSYGALVYGGNPGFLGSLGANVMAHFILHKRWKPFSKGVLMSVPVAVAAYLIFMYAALSALNGSTKETIFKFI